MRILVLGGTIFLGRHIVEEAFARGHDITLFNRGIDQPELYPDSEKLRGDRDGGLDALRGKRWDVVIDTSGQLPRLVRDSAHLLADAVDHYTFVSSISAYADFSKPVDENTPVIVLEDPNTDERTPENYGGHKALCEQATEAALPGRALIIRPGLIVGPYDPTDRFTYWPHRVAKGGELLTPAPPSSLVQFIDGRDLAAWMLDMAEQRQTGVYNATGPATPCTIGTLLDACQQVSGSDAQFAWASEQFLSEHQVEAWSDMPLWIPSSEVSMAGHNAANCQKAIAAGLRFRPMADTIQDTLAWAATRPADHQWQAGLTPERETMLLTAWHNAQL